MKINESVFENLPVLETERLRLRPVRSDDLEALFAIRSDPTMMQYIGRPLMKNHTEAEALLALIRGEYEAGTGIKWAITFRDQDEMIGNMMFRGISREHFSGEIGYMLHSDFWRKGIMREAAARGITFAFEELGLHSVFARIDPANAASAGILEKLGFQKSAHLRENYFFEGAFTDTGMYDLLAHEWKNPNKKIR